MTRVRIACDGLAMPSTRGTWLHAIKKVREGRCCCEKILCATHGLLSLGVANPLVWRHTQTLRHRDESVSGALELVDSVWNDLMALRNINMQERRSEEQPLARRILQEYRIRWGTF